MKKFLKFILLFVFIFFLPFITTYAEEEDNEKAIPLTCVYGPSSNDYYRLIQTTDGEIKFQMTNRANVDYEDLSSASAIYWGGDSIHAGDNTVLKKPLDFSETTKYVDNHLIGCPNYLVSTDDSGFNISKWNTNFFKDDEENCDSRFKFCLENVFKTENVPTYFNDPSSSYEGLEPITECTALLGDPIEDIGSPAYYLVKAFHVIKYVALVLLIVLSVVDVTGAIAKQDKDAMTKLLNKIMMRFILCIIIFLLPYLITLLLKYFVYRQTTLCEANW